jgi:ankyrin repeat protein
MIALGARLDAVDPATGTTAVHEAVQCDHPQALLLLLLNRAPANTTNRDSATPLHLAASRGATHCASVLIRNGANLDLKDAKGKTALDIAVDSERADCVTLLRLAQLAKQDERDESFMEALQAFSYDAQKSPP